MELMSATACSVYVYSSFAAILAFACSIVVCVIAFWCSLRTALSLFLSSLSFCAAAVSSWPLTEVCSCPPPKGSAVDVPYISEEAAIPYRPILIIFSAFRSKVSSTSLPP